MPRSSRHKSHKQSKHSSKERSDSEEDVKMRERNGKGEGSVRVSSEKRKLSSSKDPSARGNGSAAEEHVASKRRKEKVDVIAAASDRWGGGGDEKGDGAIKEAKIESSRIDAEKSKALGDSKSRSSRKHESGSGDKKEGSVGLVAEKEETKSTSRVDSKRKSEKDSGPKEVLPSKDSKEVKEKERGVEKERKNQDIKREKEMAVDGETARDEERQGKRGRENTERPIQEELRNPESEKELERRMRKKRDGSNDKDRYQDDVNESERLSSRGERAKDGRYTDEKHKEGVSVDENREDGDRGNRHRDHKYREDAEKDGRRRDVKYQEDGGKEYRHRDGKYREDGERDNRQKDDKYREDGDRDKRRRDDKYRDEGDRDIRHRDDKYRDDGDRDIRHRDDKYREDGDRDNRNRHDKYREDGDRDYRQRGDKYREDGDRDDRRRDDRYLDDGNRDSKNRDDKNWEDLGRDSRYKEGMQRDDNDKDKRLRDVKYRDEWSSRDRTSDRSDIKHLRDESNAAELHHRKSTNRDASPIFDDQSSRYKDDKGRRRTSDKEDHCDIRSRSTKEQNYDAGKKSSNSAIVELLSDRGRSNSRNHDLETTPNHSRRRSSPSSSSHAVKEHYRHSKQEESNYRDFAQEERIRYNVTSSKEYAAVTAKASLSRSIEKPFQKDASNLGEISAEMRSREDARTSPMQMVEKSPLSVSADRRHLNRSDVRRSLDIEDSGQKSGGSRDAKNHFGREGRGSGSRELPMETHPGDELSQADGDNLSVSSPFSRNSHFTGNSRSLLPPPPPFRMGADNSPRGLGSLEDDNRGNKPNNRHRRIGDPSMGRGTGSPWRGVPNWPSPVANGFIPFQHGPSPVGFHPLMQQFPAPPMFRPPMELNQPGVPYHVPDADRFSGHGHPPPPIHGWDANNAVFGDESRMYGRLNWDHNRSLTGGRGWETSSGTVWKGHNSGASTELLSAPQKGDYLARGPGDEVWPSQDQQAQNDEQQPSAEVESVDIDESNDDLVKNDHEAPETIPKEISNLSRKDGARLSHLYLSMLDISPDLTQPELYSQYTTLLGRDQNIVYEEDDPKFFLVNAKMEAMDAAVNVSNKTSNASLFPTMNDSVLLKAMSLYKKTRVVVSAINGGEVPFSNVENLESAATLDQEGAASNDDPGEEVVPDCGQQEAIAVASALNKVKIEVSPEITTEKIDEEIIAAVNEVKMEVDPVSELQGTMDSVFEDQSLCVDNVERSGVHSPSKAEELNEGEKLHDAKCGVLLFSDVSADEACEAAVLPELVESGSVNLSRIHQSPESTH